MSGRGPHPGELVVRGEARREVEPDRAGLWLTVVGDGPSPAEAMDALAPRARALDEVLDGRAGALRSRSTSALSVREVVEHDPRTGRPRTTGYEAQRVTTVEVHDLGAVASLVREAIDRPEARLAGPAWRIGDEHPVHDEVRAAAAVDARRQADAYAGALGLGLSGVEWVRAPELAAGGPAGRAMPRAFAAAATAEAVGGGGDAVDVQAGRITVAAAIDVAFRFSV